MIPTGGNIRFQYPGNTFPNIPAHGVAVPTTIESDVKLPPFQRRNANPRSMIVPNPNVISQSSATNPTNGSFLKGFRKRKITAQGPSKKQRSEKQTAQAKNTKQLRITNLPSKYIISFNEFLKFPEVCSNLRVNKLWHDTILSSEATWKQLCKNWNETTIPTPFNYAACRAELVKGYVRRIVQHCNANFDSKDHRVIVKSTRWDRETPKPTNFRDVLREEHLGRLIKYCNDKGDSKDNRKLADRI